MVRYLYSKVTVRDPLGVGTARRVTDPFGTRIRNGAGLVYNIEASSLVLTRPFLCIAKDECFNHFGLVFRVTCFLISVTNVPVGTVNARREDRYLARAPRDNYSDR